MYLRITKARNFILTLLISVVLIGCESAEDTQAVEIQSHLERSNAYEQQGQYRAAIIEARNMIQKDGQNNLGYHRLAELYLATGEFKPATDILLLTPSPNIETDLLLAESHIGRKKYTSASQSLNSYASNNGDTSTTKYRLLEIKSLFGTNQTESARTKLTTLITEQPDNVDAKLLLATTYLNQQDYQQTLAIIQQILVQYPNNAEALYINSQLAYFDNKLDLAEEYLTLALQQLPETDTIQPLRIQVLRQLSQVLTEQGRTSEALIYSKVIASAYPQQNEATEKFSSAISMLQSGDIIEAEKTFEELNTAYPNNGLSSLYLGLINFQRGDFASAEALLQDNVDTETASPALIQTTALAKLRVQKNDEALQILKEALVTHPENEQILSMYGVTALQLGQEQEGTIALEKALAINPEKIELRLALASYYQRNQQQDRGIAHLQKALKQAPTNVDVVTAYVQTMQQAGQTELAADAVQELIAASPESAGAQNLEGHFALATGNIEQAKTAYQKTLKIEANNSTALFALGNIAIKSNQYETAANYYQKTIDADPTLTNAYKGLVAAYELNGEPNKAVTTLQTLAKKQQDVTAAPATVLAEYYLRKNNLAKASQYLEDIYSLDTHSSYQDSIYTNIKLAQAQQSARAENLEMARKHLLDAIEKAPAVEAPYNALIGLEIQNKRYTQAEQIIKSTEENFPNSTATTLARAELLNTQNGSDAAIAFLKQAWDKQPSDAIAEGLVKIDAADEQLLAQWQQTSPNNPRPVILQALNAQQTSNYDKAIGLYELANQLSPNNVAVLNNLAWLYFENKDERAEATAEQAYLGAQDNPQVMDTYGWILVSNGNTEKGIELLEQALSKAPSNTEIQAHLNFAKAK
jgi:putative PEP-CTERM system TPR-repeat lipoprotein